MFDFIRKCLAGTRRTGVGAIVMAAVLVWLAGCAGSQKTAPSAEEIISTGLQEKPVPEAPFREHVLARCQKPDQASTTVEKYLGSCAAMFREGSGSDGMIELEIGLSAGQRDPLILMTLGQLYLLAGQGNPDLLPTEGPAADLGSYEKNKPRLLKRARQLLEEARTERPDDAAIDYLLADVARTGGDQAKADDLTASAFEKCTGGRSFRMMRMYQQLYEYPPKHRGGPSPEYPQAAVNAGIEGDVVLDLLLSPAGEVQQYVVVNSPGKSLTKSAWQSLQNGRFEAARVGKYAVWSWLRVTTSFTLS